MIATGSRVRNRQPAIRQRPVWCVRCQHQYELGFSSNGRACAACPACQSKDWSLRQKEEVDALCIQWQNLPAWVVNGKTIKRLEQWTLRALDIDELVSEGHVALVVAAQKWDDKFISPTTGSVVKFSTYAATTIERRLSNWITLQLSTGAAGLPMQDDDRQSAEQGWMPTRRRRAVHRALPHHSFETRLDGCDEAFPTPDLQVPDPGDDAAQNEAFASLKNAMGRLRERDRDILHARIWDGQTLRTIAIRLGVTKERVRQLEARAMAALADMMGGPMPEAWLKMLKASGADLDGLDMPLFTCCGSAQES